MGRPRKDEQREDEFRQLVQRMLGERSEYWLAKNLGEDRSTIGRFLRGLSTCPEQLKILDLFKPSDDVAFRFRSTSKEGRGLYVRDTDQSPHHSSLNRGLEHLLRGQWSNALARFDMILKTDSDHLDRADAYYHKAWVFCELGRRKPCLKNCRASIEEISAMLDGMPLDFILATLQGTGESAVLSRSSRATIIIGNVLGLWAKYLAQQVVYGSQSNAYEQDVSDTFLAYKRARLLEEWLGEDHRLSHLLRWNAVVLARTDQQHTKAEVGNLLAASSAGLDAARNENGRAYLERDMGLVALFQGDSRFARTHLRDAIPQFIELNDHRGLAPVFVALSHLEADGVAYDRAQRCALAGAALQPYSYVAARATQLYAHSSEELIRDVAKLHASTSSFKGLPSLLERINSNSGQSAYTTINQNLGSIFPHYAAI